MMRGPGAPHGTLRARYGSARDDATMSAVKLRQRVASTRRISGYHAHSRSDGGQRTVKSFSDRIFQAIVAVFVVTGVVVPTVICLAYAAGAFRVAGPDRPELAEVSDYVADTNAALRVGLGAIGGFMLAAGATMWQLRRSAHELSGRFLELETEQRHLHAYLQPDVDGALRKRDELSSLGETLRGAESLQMLGMSLSNFTSEHSQRVSEVLQRGGHCQFLLVAPDSSASDVVAKTFYEAMPQRQYDTQIETSLARLDQVGARWAGSGSGSSLEIRTIDALPTTSITIVNRERVDGSRMIVEMYTPTSSSADRPHMELSAITSPIWYRYFCSEFDELWERATIYKVHT